MKPVVLKFGGTSVGDAAAMRQVAELVERALPASPVVVLSAMAGVTNGLLAAARSAEAGELAEALETAADLERRHHETAAELFGEVPDGLAAELAKRFDELSLLLRGVALLRELSDRSGDAIAGFGERLSTLVFAAFLESRGVAVTRVDARTVIRTDDRFGHARPDRPAIKTLAAERVRPHVGEGRTVVTQGYIAATDEGVSTTLGRGGSDYSAALMAEALEAAELQIWTDVEGVFTCDPRIVSKARHIAELSFAEAAELAAFGAKVLHPATIQPAVQAGVPVTVRDTRHPDGRFTTITGQVATGRAVTALASRGGIAVITVTSTKMLEQSGFLERLFEVFGRHHVDVDVLATAEVSVSMTVDADSDLDDLLAELGEFCSVEVATDRAIVAVIGERLKATAGLGMRIFGALSEINVEMISMGANEINLSLVVREEDVADALRSLHAALFEGDGGGPA